jgi:hypothetical protein
MAIDIGAIHNLVRTYQRALHGFGEPPPEVVLPSTPSQEDRVSFSTEARERSARSATPSTLKGEKT